MIRSMLTMAIRRDTVIVGRYQACSADDIFQNR
jgi:hypothetical protein